MGPVVTLVGSVLWHMVYNGQIRLGLHTKGPWTVDSTESVDASSLRTR